MARHLILYGVPATGVVVITLAPAPNAKHSRSDIKKNVAFLIVKIFSDLYVRKRGCRLPWRRVNAGERKEATMFQEAVVNKAVKQHIKARPQWVALSVKWCRIAMNWISRAYPVQI